MKMLSSKKMETLKKIEEQYESFCAGKMWSKMIMHIDTQTMKQNSSKKTSEAKKQKNSQLNRYLNVLPYDDSRVKLNRIENDYINASLVKVEKAKINYILTQGPLYATLEHFWLMLWEQNSKLTIMLNKVIEDGENKCYQFWPTNEKLDLKTVNLEVELISEDKKSDFVIREFKITDKETKTDRIVYQYHYLGWPDFGVPRNPKSFIKFLFSVKNSGYLDSNVYGPSVIHCSAGIGRSGTFCLIESCVTILNNEIDKDLNISDILLEMRQYRNGLIQTPEQLRFAYEAIIESIKTKNLEENNCLEKQEQKTAVEDSTVNASKEIRKRQREDKNKKTMDQIKKIKEKQKEADKMNSNSKFLKYVGISCGVMIFVTWSYYSTFPRLL